MIISFLGCPDGLGSHWLKPCFIKRADIQRFVILVRLICDALNCVKFQPFEKISIKSVSTFQIVFVPLHH